MTTDAIRAKVQAAATASAKVWPNGLAFDLAGWTYRPEEHPALAGMWGAYRHETRAAVSYFWRGYGRTPIAARAAARRVA